MSEPVQALTIDQLKQNLANTFSAAYSEFINRIKSLPGNPVFIQRAMGYFDDGFLNFREALYTLNIQPISPIPDSETPKQTEPDAA